MAKKACFLIFFYISCPISQLQLFSGVDSCSGDSGGPLVYESSDDDDNKKYFQIGILSYGTRTCGIGIPAVYTRVIPYLQWIESKLEP